MKELKLELKFRLTGEDPIYANRIHSEEFTHTTFIGIPLSFQDKENLEVQLANNIEFKIIG